MSAHQHFEHATKRVVARHRRRGTRGVIGAVTTTNDAHTHAIARDRVLGFSRWNEEIAFAIVNVSLEETHSARREFDDAFDLFGKLRQTQLLILADVEQPFLGELAHCFVEGSAVEFAYAKLPRDVMNVDRKVVAMREVIEDA